MLELYILAGVCAYAQQKWCAARFTASLPTYTVNTYAADVRGVEFGSHIHLCAKSQSFWKACMRLQKVMISPNLPRFCWHWHGACPKLNNLVFLSGFQWCAWLVPATSCLWVMPKQENIGLVFMYIHCGQKKHQLTFSIITPAFLSRFL